MATTGQDIIDQIRAKVKELAPDQITDKQILQWSDDATMNLYRKAIDVLEDRYQDVFTSAVATPTLDTWRTITVSVTTGVYRPTKAFVAFGANKYQARGLRIRDIESIGTNANFSKTVAFSQYQDKKFQFSFGSDISPTGATTFDIWGVKKPVLMSPLYTGSTTPGGLSLDMPDEFHDLVKIQVEQQAWEAIQREDKSQQKAAEFANRLSDIESSYRMVVTQQDEMGGKALGVR